MPDKPPQPAPNKPVPANPPAPAPSKRPNSPKVGIRVEPIEINDYQGGAGAGFGLGVEPIKVGGIPPGYIFGIGLGPKPYDPTHRVEYGPLIRRDNKGADGQDGKRPDPPQRQGNPGAIGSIGVPGIPGSGYSLPAYLLPLKAGFDPDVRFKIKSPRVHSDLSPLPLGSVVLVTESTTEKAQGDLVLPTDNRLVAANRGPSADYGTRVCDIGLRGEFDTRRVARLQTAFRVLRRPTGTLSLEGNGQNSIAWTIGRTGLGDELGGFVTDGPEDEAVHAHVSCRNGGPFDVGDGVEFEDKHQIGVDWDGRPINALHFSTTTLFNAPPNWVKDGPLVFENGSAPYATEGPIPQPCHILWDRTWPYDFPRDGAGRMTGAWRIFTWSTVYAITEDDPPPVTTGGGDGGGGGKGPTTGGGDGGGPTTGGGGGGPTTGGGGGGGPTTGGGDGRPGYTPPLPKQTETGGAAAKYPLVSASVSEHLSGPVSARPQIVGEGVADFYHATRLTTAQRAEADRAPVVMRSFPFGAQSGGQFQRTAEAGKSSLPGGTASGGWLHLPPELGPLDAASGWAPVGVTVSDSAHVYGPGVATVHGTVDPDTGTIDDGVRMIRNSSGSVAIEALVAGAWTRVATWSGDGLRVKSGASAIIESGASASVLAGGSVTLGEGVNVALGTGTGSKLGTGTNQRIGFFNATPVVQQATVTTPTGGGTVDTEARSSINEIKALLTALGLTA